MLVLFLDFDGVLHPMRGNVVAESAEHFESSPLLWALLRDHPSMQVVFSTSWRLHYPLETLRRFVTQGGGEDLAYRFVGITPNLAKTSGVGRGYRQLECEAWLDQSGAPRRAWLALDDFPAFFHADCTNLYAINGATGLVAPDIPQISAIAKRMMQPSQFSEDQFATTLPSPSIADNELKGPNREA